MNPATIFFRYVSVGLLLQSLLVLVFKISGAGSDSGTSLYLAIGLAVSIVLASSLAIFGYVYAIKQSDEALNNENAADLAYYLGFSLTVGALAISFVVDLFLLQGAGGAERSSLIQGSLGQFGAGLIATVLGLIAKIHLNSVQELALRDPTELYRDFRSNIRELSDSLVQTSSGLRNAFEAATEQLAQGAEKSKLALLDLTVTIVEAKAVVADSLSKGNIEQPVKNFSDQMVALSDSIEALKTCFPNIQTEIVKFGDSISAAAAETQRFSAAAGATLVSNATLVKELDNLSATVSNFAATTGESVPSLVVLGETSSKLSKTLDNLKDESAKGVESMKSLALPVESLSSQLGVLNNEFENLASSASSLDNSISSIANASERSGEATKKLATSIELISGRSVVMAECVDKSASSLSNLSQGLTGASQASATFSANVTPMVDETAKLRAELGDLRDQIRELSISLKTLDTSSRGAASWIGDLSRRLFNRNPFQPPQ